MRLFQAFQHAIEIQGVPELCSLRFGLKCGDAPSHGRLKLLWRLHIYLGVCWVCELVFLMGWRLLRRDGVTKHHAPRHRAEGMVKSWKIWFS